MIFLIKKALPAPLKKALLVIKHRTYDHWKKRHLAKKMAAKHKELLSDLKGKERVKVVFLVLHKSVWKVDSVFKKMLSNPLFEPLILVCPCINYGEERMRQDMKEALEYFQGKGYPVRSSYHEAKGRWLALDDIKPDIVFFTNPHKLTRKEYYEEAYLNYLSCYVPYHHEVVNNAEQFSQFFHVAQWKIFASNDSAMDLYKSLSPALAGNVIATGYPAMEIFLEKIKSNSFDDVWKTKDGRLRIIWAPHHSVEMSKETPYANFLDHADFFKELAEKYKEKVIWCFKPHPLLRPKLYRHPDWGVIKTDEYYEFWRSRSFTQLAESEYVDLFCSSDAMIHDSGSFLAEYLYVRKPVLYTISAINKGNYYSEFGSRALNACSHARSKKDIELFVKDLIQGREISDEHDKFLENEVNKFFGDFVPSERILKSIADDFFN